MAGLRSLTLILALAMAGSLSLTLSLAPNWANIGEMQKTQCSAESTTGFLKPNTYLVCQTTDFGMIGEEAALKQIKAFYMLAETIQTEINRLNKTVAEQEENVHKLEQILAHSLEHIKWLVENTKDMNARVDKTKKKFARPSDSDDGATDAHAALKKSLDDYL